MHRCLRWWRWIWPRQHAPVTEPMTTEQETAYWLDQANRRREVLDKSPDAPASEPTAPIVYEPLTPEQWRREEEEAVAESEAWCAIARDEPPPQMPSDRLAQAELTAIGNACWPDWQPPIRALPCTARRILADTSVVFTADGLPLMDDPFVADFNWSVSAFDALTKAKQRMERRQRQKLYQLQRNPQSGTLTYTVFAPPLWCEDEAAIRNVERELRRQINESVCFAVWARVTFTWRTSNDPAWAVSIAAVDAPMEEAA
jgi:hypothetical protein